MTHIHQDGKVYELTGEYRPPRGGEPFISNLIPGRVYTAKWDAKLTHEDCRIILREVKDVNHDEYAVDTTTELNQLREENKRLNKYKTFYDLSLTALTSIQEPHEDNTNLLTKIVEMQTTITKLKSELTTKNNHINHLENIISKFEAAVTNLQEVKNHMLSQ